MGFRIGELARATGTKAETVRYYETIGLLGAPDRSEGNYRVYDAVALNRLSFIRRARALGFSIDEVRQLLDLSDERDRPCGAVDEMARTHLAAVDRKIGDLQALRLELGSLLDQCRKGTIAHCRIIDALGPS